MQEVFEKNTYIKAIDDAIEKFLEYGCFCIEWNPKLPKEKLVEDVLRQVKGQSVYILEKLKQKEIEIVDQVAEEYVPDIYVGKNGWIPCSERLPDNGAYIVSGHWFKNEMKVVCFADYYNHWCCDALFTVEAWRPLPEPYKGE